MKQSIDAVITWVDGNDPKLKAKQRLYFQAKESDGVASASRFTDCNEIFYCISAIIRNAPFIQRVFIVTDDQYPPVIAQIERVFGAEVAGRIAVVDHREIFRGYEAFLPTFNSVSIETVLHRIPGLSERYIYFNDDFILARPLGEEDFFVGNRPVLRGMWRKSSLISFNSAQRKRMIEGKFYITAKMFSYKEAQYLSFRMLGFDDRFFWHDHTPHPFFRPALESFFAEHEDALLENIRHRVRNCLQFDTMSLANAMEIRKGGATFRDTALTYLKPSAKIFQGLYVRRKRQSFQRRQSDFLCVQELSSTKPEARDAIFAWLDDLLFAAPEMTGGGRLAL